MFQISERTTSQYTLGAYDDTYVIPTSGYCSSTYTKAKILQANKIYYVLAETTHAEAITLSFMSIHAILIKEYL